jgi:hypothetical protein
MIDDAAIHALFARYERLFNMALGGDDVNMDEVAALYATEFIGAAPAGVRAGRNDDGFRQAIAEGYAQYRTIGTKSMRIRGLHLTPIDAQHCLVRVAWTANYARDDLPETAIDFDVAYFVQTLDGTPKVFGWVTGDEEGVLRAHGIL